MEPLTKTDVLKMIYALCLSCGSQKEWAKKCGISEAYLSDILRGNREPSEMVLKALGLKKVVTYEYLPQTRKRLGIR